MSPPMTEPNTYAIRQLSPDEHALVFNTWLRSAASSRLWRHLADRAQRFYAFHHDLVEEALACCQAVVAYLPEEPDVVLGWIVFESELLPERGAGGIPVLSVKEPPILHYLFTKERYRRSGVANALLKHAFGPKWKSRRVVYTHRVSNTARSPDPKARPGSAEAVDGTLPVVPAVWEFCAYPFLLLGASVATPSRAAEAQDELLLRAAGGQR